MTSMSTLSELSTIRSSSAKLSRSAIRMFVDQQGLWRCAESAVTDRERDALGLWRSRVRKWYKRSISNRSSDAFHFWRFQSSVRCDGARVWALLSDANLLLALRLPHRPQSCRSGATRISKLSDQVQSGRKDIPDVWL